MRKFIMPVMLLLVIILSAGVVSANEDIDTNSSNNTFQNNSNVTSQYYDVIISGNVVDCQNGKPFAGVNVKVSTLKGSTVGYTQTDANGNYNIYFLSDEISFFITASTSGHLPYTKQVSTVLNQTTGKRNAWVNFRLGQPAVSVTSPNSTFINESFQLQVTFDNPSNSTGFGPIVELILPSQVNFTSATYLNNAITTYNLGIFNASGQIYNPLTRQYVNGTPGTKLIILEYPFGSFTPDQPPATAVVNCFMAANATIGLPLNISAIPVFRFGNDPVDNPLTDPPIYGATTNTTVTPTVIRLTKTNVIHEGETVTGPNFPVTYLLQLDIATGAIVTNISITDLLNGNLQFVALTNNGSATSVSLPSTSIPGGLLVVNFTSLTGVAGIDKNITYTAYGPEFNDTNGSVINSTTGVSRLTPNDSRVNGTYNSTSVSDNGPATDYTITLKSLAIQKSVTDLNGINVKPTDTLQYTINFQVSDYFEFKNIVITDIVGDGQSFLASFIPLLTLSENGTNTSIPFNLTNYVVTHDNATGTWTIVFNVSQQLIDAGQDGILTGGLYYNRTNNRGATTGTITFRTLIDIMYENPANFPSGDAFLTSNDVTNNTVNINALLTNSNNSVSDGSGSSVTIVAPNILKQLYAVNGNTTSPTNLIKPGDKVTFSLWVQVPTTNLESFTIKDFLPIPFFRAIQMTYIGQGDTPPDVGQWALASDDTLSSFLGRLPTLTNNSLDNTLTFSYGLVNSTDQVSRIVHILFTVNATNEPMADELYLTNLMNIIYGNSPGDSFTDNTIISFITQEPELVITKGVYNTTGNGTISPLPTFLPVNGDLTGADAGDKITYLITVENQGNSIAYDVIIKENVPSGMINPTLIGVFYGNGTQILNFTGNLFDNLTGLLLNNLIFKNDGSIGPPYGNDTILIYYSFDIDSNVTPRQVINNTAGISNFASTPGGPNYVQDPTLFQDSALVTIASPSISKTLVNSTDSGTSGNNLTIGEVGTFRIQITLPEGQVPNLTIIDTLPNGLAYAGNYTIDAAAFNGTLGTISFSNVSNIIQFLFQGNTTVNPDNNNATNTFYIDLKTVVQNNLTANPISASALPKTNTVSLNWDNNPGSPLTATYGFNVVQPRLNIIKTITPNPAVGGQNVTVRLNLTNAGLSPAYNVIITDPLNGTVFNWATVVENSTASGFTFSYNNVTGIVTYTGGSLNPGQNAIFTFNVTLMGNIFTNSSYNNTVNATYDSLNSTTAPRDDNRNYTVTNSTLLRTVAPSISKLINKTSEPDSTGTNVFIGEVVTYQVDITIPAGVTRNVTISDLLNNGTAYITGRSVISRSSNNISADGFSFTSLNLSDFQTIIQTTITPNLTFFLGNITNTNPTGANETIRLLFDVVVRNNNSNIANRNITNVANITFFNASNQSRNIASSQTSIMVRLPNLNITKTANPSTLQGTEPITFTIVVTNGNGALAPVYDGIITDLINTNFINIRNIVVTNSTPMNLTQSLTGNNLTITFDRLLNNSNITITFTVDLKSNITFNQTTSNQVNVTGTSLPGTNGTGGQTPGAPGTDTGERTGDPTQPAGAINNLNATAIANVTARSPTISKNSGGSKNVTRTIGATAPQTIIVTVPIGTTNRLRVTDLVPSGLLASGFTYIIGGSITPQYASPTPTFNSTTNTWEFDFGEVNSTQLDNITINYIVTVLNVSSNQNGVNLTNNATVYYNNVTGEVNGGSSITTTQVIEPNLLITKNGTTNINPGDICTFTLYITHSAQSTSDAFDLMVLDTIPSDMVYLDTIQLPGSWTIDITQLPGKIIFTGPQILLGQNATIIFRCTLNNNSSLAGQNRTNIANLTYSSINGTDPNERAYNATGNTTIHILGADIYVTKNGPATIFAGQQINYTVVVGNNGPDTAFNVTLNDLIDPTWFAMMYNVQYRINANVTWNTFTNPLTLSLGNISTLGSVTIYVRGTINSSAPLGFLNNSVNVTTTTPDPNTTNNSAQTSTQVQHQADIVVDKTGPATVLAGNKISYSILVTNNGPSDAQNVHVIDSIPAQLINIIYSTNGGLNWISWPPAGGYVDLGTLISGQSATVLINATVPSSTANGTILNNSVNATTTTPDPTPATDYVNTTVNTQADLQVDKTGPLTIVAGNQIVYTISVVNNGPSDALNVHIIDNIPSQLINVQYSIDNGINWISWPPSAGYIDLGTILANITNNSRLILIMGTVNPSTANGTNLNNTVNVTTTTPDPTPNVDTVITTVQAIADIHVIKNGPASAVAGQDIIKYTITVGNNGPSVAHSTMLYDNITFLNNVQYSLNDVNWFNWTGSLLLGELNPGSVTNVFIRGLVPADALGTLNNTVTVNTASSDPYPGNNTASVLTLVNTSADIYVNKSAPTSVVAGQNITFTLNVGNNGPSVARDVVLNDNIVATILNPQYSLNGGLNWNNWVGTLSLGNLTNGSIISVLIRGNVSPDTLGIINNAANVSTTTPDPVPYNDTSNTSTTVNTVADVFVVKSGPGSAVAGRDNVTYSIVVGNNGPSVARDVVLTDLVPAFILSPVYSLNGGSWLSWTGSLDLGNLSVGNVSTILISGNLSSNATGVLNNTANVSSSTFDPYLTNNTASALTDVDTVADVFVVKSGPGSAVAGRDNVTYSIVVGNNGPSNARNVVLIDLVPAYILNPVYSFDGVGWSSWLGSLSLGNLSSGGSLQLFISGNLSSNATGVLNNTANVSTSTFDPFPGNDSSSVLTNVNTSADIYVIKSGSSSTVVAGQDVLTYTIVVGNNGPSDAQGVTLVDYISPMVLNPICSINGGSWSSWNGSANLGTLFSGAEVTVLIRGNVSSQALGTINNTANVSSSTHDPNPGNDSSTISTNVSTIADIYVIKTGPSQAIAGHDVVIYTILVGNNGPSVARNVVLNDLIPPVLLGGEYSTNGLNWLPWPSSLNLGDMDPNSILTILIRGNLSADALGTVNNTANVNSSTFDPYLNNNTASALTNVDTSADIYVIKSGSSSTVVAGQDVLTYSIVVGNNGPSVARDVVLTDLVPAFILSPVYSLNGGSWLSWTGSLSLGNLSVGNVSTILIRGNVSSDALGTVNNTANVSSSTTDPFPGNDSSSVLTDVDTVADVFVVKSGPVSAVAGRDNVTYSIVVGNNGPSVARDVVLTDLVPAYILSPVYSFDGVGWSSWLGSLSLGNLSSGGSLQLFISGNLSSNATGVLNNMANVSTSTWDPVPENNTSSVLTDVLTVADIYVNKSGPTSAVAGLDTINYTIVVGNNGPSDALNVSLIDAVPPEILNPVYSIDNGITWNVWSGSLVIGTLTPQQTFNISVMGNLSAGALGVINNTANVTTTTFDPVLENNTASALTVANTEADIYVTKNAPAQVVAGRDVLIYNISVGNNGPSIARNISLTDIINPFLLNPIYSLDGVNWNVWNGLLNIGDLNPGDLINISISGNVSAAALGWINNTVNVSSTTFDPYLVNNTANVSTQVETMADVFVVKSGPGSAIAGRDTITYTILVGNNGPSVARDVLISDPIPIEIINSIYSLNNIDWSNWNGSFSIGDMNPGSIFNIFIKGNLSSGALGILNNTATVESTTYDPNPENNTASALTVVNTEADIYVIKTGGPNPVIAGPENVTYNILVGNNGPSVARQIILSDLIPSEIINPVYSLDNGLSWFNWTGTINLGNFTPNQTLEILIRGFVSAAANSTIHNTVTVGSDTPDPYPENNTYSNDIRIKTADIAVVKTVNNSTPNYLNNITFNITVTNNGPDGATGVQLKDILPNGFKFISYTATQGTYNNSTGLWNIGSLDNGASAVLKIIAQVIKSNTTMVNNASKTAENEFDPNPSNDNSSVTVTVAPAADLNIKKTVDYKYPYLGKTIHFTIIVQNRGPDTSIGVYVRDILPKGLKYRSYTANYGTYNYKTGIWTIGNLPRNTIARLTITSVTTTTGKKTNTAVVESMTYDPILYPNDNKSSTATVTVLKPKPKPKPLPPRRKKVVIPMKRTGVPFAAFVAAMFMLVGGLISARKLYQKNR